MSEIIEIDGQQYVIPLKLTGGKFTPAPECMIKIPIEMTDSFRITKRNDESPQSLFTQLMDLFNFKR